MATIPFQFHLVATHPIVFYEERPPKIIFAVIITCTAQPSTSYTLLIAEIIFRFVMGLVKC